jgi:DNA-binding NtrC family response regulator
MFLAAQLVSGSPVPPGAGADESEESAYLAAPGRGPRRGRVLIMDDDRMVRETMRRQLVISGYEVTATACGEDAVAAYRLAREAGAPFAAVILDLKVDAGWGGEQTLAELLSVDPAVKAAVCSGTLAESVDHYRQQGFSGVLGKPYALGDLRRLVELLLQPAAGA